MKSALQAEYQIWKWFEKRYIFLYFSVEISYNEYMKKQMVSDR